MDNFCVCCGAIIPEGRMVCPMCEMAADEGNAKNWLKEEEHGRQSASVNRRKTGRNEKAAVRHLFQSRKRNRRTILQVKSSGRK